MPLREHCTWPGVIVSALLIAGALTWFGDGELRTDQQAYNLLVVRLLDPSALTRDALYQHDPALLHVPLFLQAQAALARALDGDAAAALAWLAWPIGVLFLIGHYVFFRALTGLPAAAALAAVTAATMRHALGGELWGFDGVRSAATRTIAAGLVPLLLLLFLRWRARRDFPLFYLVLGGLFNVHPVTFYQLALATALAHVALERRLRALREVAIGLGLFVLGALPYLVPFVRARDNATDAATLSLARAALHYKFPYLFYPIAPSAVLSVLLHAALPLIAWLLWRRRLAPELRRPLEAVAIAAVGVAIVGTAVVQLVGVALDRPYVDIQLLRATRLAYPVLLGGFALGLAALLSRATPRALAGAAALFVAALIPPNAVIHAFADAPRDAVKTWLGLARSPRIVASGPLAWAPGSVAAAAVGSPVSRAAVDRWSVAHTSRDAVFFTDDFDFRIQTRRAITGAFKDGALFFLAGNRPFTAWYRGSLAIDGCRAAGGGECWFALARAAAADYALVDPRLAQGIAPNDFVKVFEADGWSVWQRMPAQRR